MIVIAVCSLASALPVTSFHFRFPSSGNAVILAGLFALLDLAVVLLFGAVQLFSSLLLPVNSTNYVLAAGDHRVLGRYAPISFLFYIFDLGGACSEHWLD